VRHVVAVTVVMAFGTAGPGDDIPKRTGLCNAGIDIPPDHRLFHLVEIGTRIDPQQLDSHNPSTVDADNIKNGAEQWQGDYCGNKLGGDQIFKWIQGHGFQGIDLFGDAHDADLGRDGAAGPAGYHQGR